MLTKNLAHELHRKHESPRTAPSIGELNTREDNDLFSAFVPVTYAVPRTVPCPTTNGPEPRFQTIPYSDETRLMNFWKVFNQIADPDHLFEEYMRLPSPRLKFLSHQQIHRLFDKFAPNKDCDYAAVTRYLTLINDMRQGGVPVTRVQWNQTLSSVTKFRPVVTRRDIHIGLVLWKEMERDSERLSDTTTFNILFHLAARSNFKHLPIMVFNEMRKRDIVCDRYTYVNLIVYHGAQGNGSGIRTAYNELLRSGEIVDIVVLNAVMTALIDAGEPSAAQEILTRLKLQLMDQRQESQTHRPGSGTHLKHLKSLITVLKSKGFDANESLQQRNLAPNIVSFAIFIDYHSSHTADFDKVLALLHDISTCGVYPECSIFQSLFKGFALHGTARYTPWTAARLSAIYDAFMDGEYAIDENVCLWCARAHLVLEGRRKAHAIWESVRQKWQRQGGDEREIQIAGARITKMHVR